jgi:hypothetical protein
MIKGTLTAAEEKENRRKIEMNLYNGQISLPEFSDVKYNCYTIKNNFPRIQVLRKQFVNHQAFK